VWPGNLSVDVEVTTAVRKDKHVECEAFAKNLMAALFEADREFDLVIDLADPPRLDDCDAILTLAQTITSGQTVGDSSRWEMRAEANYACANCLLHGRSGPAAFLVASGSGSLCCFERLCGWS
jgi:hypothetical protein